jgi:hypothetical protein
MAGRTPSSRTPTKPRNERLEARISSEQKALFQRAAELQGRDAAWDALAAHRDAEIESGSAIAVSGPEVVARLRAELE